MDESLSVLGGGLAVTQKALSGTQVLLVEDEPLVSFLLEDMLEELGCEVVARASTIAAAMKQVDRVQFHVAVLDVNIAGEKIYPVAERIERRSLPIVFSTGYGAVGVAEDWRRYPVVGKPFRIDDLCRALMRALEA